MLLQLFEDFFFIAELWFHGLKECVGLTSACGIGTLNLDVPDFVDLVQSEEDKTATLSVRDPNAKEQKEMWGTLSFYTFNSFTEKALLEHC